MHGSKPFGTEDKSRTTRAASPRIGGAAWWWTLGIYGAGSAAWFVGCVGYWGWTAIPLGLLMPLLVGGLLAWAIAESEGIR